MHAVVLGSKLLLISYLMLLTQDSLARWNGACLAAETDGATRVKVFTMSGVSIGKAGIGAFDVRLTCPRRHLVGDALAGTKWIRFATAGEMRTDEEWWRYCECLPATLVHGFCDDEGHLIVTAAEHHMRLMGSFMQPFDQRRHIVSFELFRNRIQLHLISSAMPAAAWIQLSQRWLQRQRTALPSFVARNTLVSLCCSNDHELNFSLPRDPKCDAS